MDILNKIGRAASNAASSASNKAEEMREINKLKGEQNEMKSEYSSTKRKLADYAFKKYQAGELEDESIKEFCAKMENLRNDIDGIDEKIKEIKQEYEERATERAEERIHR